jgi:xanthine dehydrogenase iron-sulfur cluster and FAD-binding subunit A
MATIRLSVNGKALRIDTEPERPLLEVLREDLRLTGTKYGCGEGLRSVTPVTARTLSHHLSRLVCLCTEGTISDRLTRATRQRCRQRVLQSTSATAQGC